MKQRYFYDLTAMNVDSCVSPSRIGQEPPSVGPYQN